MFTNRRPYYGLKMSTTDFFREPVRFLKESNTQESMMEKPYLEDEYPKMHLKLPDFKFKPKEIPSIFGPIADGDPFPGLAMIDFGDAKCGWDVINVGHCTEGPIIITMHADYLFHAEFDFVVIITSDTIGVALSRLVGTEARGWDRQDYQLTFPENSSGSVTICGFASTHTLVSQTFETVVAGMPVGIHLINGALVPVERGQGKPATLLKSVYGDKGDDCGCITLSSSCDDQGEGECNCDGISIGYTTLLMSLGSQQTLTVEGSVEGCTYIWSIISGGGSLDDPVGDSVVYTAPSENVDCGENPIIAVNIGATLCEAIGIAINNSAVGGIAYKKYDGNVSCVGGFCKMYVGYYTCADVLNSTKFESCIYGGWISCSDSSPCSGCQTGVIDVRSDEQKDAGCCPAGLL